MKAIIIRHYGGPEVLELAHVPSPQPTAGQVLVRIEAAAVNPIDGKIRKGEMKMMLRLPFPITLGGEYAGVVTEVAGDVKRFKVGDRVFGMTPTESGAFAESIAVPEGLVGLRPSNVDAVQAASFSVGAVTALQSLRDKCELKPGQRVLINGASGSVGLAGVQIAVALGATVTAVCSAAKFDLVRAAGASDCIDYKTEDFAKLGRHWHAIFDAAATRHFANCHDALEAHGHYVTTISSGGDMMSPLLNPVRSQKSHFIMMKPNPTDIDFVRDLVEQGKLKPQVGATFPLAKTGDAIALAESGKATGKVVVTL
jgi:NADPH:quinone reductase-like Zn-dependent oxidoreductase